MDAIPALDLFRALAIVVLGASGTYLLLPHWLGVFRPRVAHLVGAGLVGVALLLLASFWSAPGPVLASIFFYSFAAAAIVGAVLTVTSRNPVYSALWFAAVVLSTTGLFLLCGAPFLAAGTVIVYAGAIIVTFLFVIMLAQMEGRALYDRMARSPARATFCCFLLFWSLLFALIQLRTPDDVPRYEGNTVTDANQDEKRLVRTGRLVELYRMPAGSATDVVIRSSVRPTAELPADRDAARPHVAGLGGTLYTDHLITVELAGALLFVGLVGAVAIATPKTPTRPGDRPAAPSA